MKPSNHQAIQYPCFPNTDIPLACLFIHLQHGYTRQQFLQDFPGVTEDMVEQAFGLAITIFKAPVIDCVFEDIDGQVGKAQQSGVANCDQVVPSD